VGPEPSDAAARQARTSARARLRDVLAATRDLRGITGTTTMDEHRNAVKPAVVLAVSQEGYKYVTTIEP
jgi:branched-chain amino acid transport system substrate-binding protein